MGLYGAIEVRFTLHYMALGLGHLERGSSKSAIDAIVHFSVTLNIFLEQKCP